MGQRIIPSTTQALSFWIFLVLAGDTVDGKTSKKPADLVNFQVFTGFTTCQVVVSDFWTINSRVCFWGFRVRKKQKKDKHSQKKWSTTGAEDDRIARIPASFRLGRRQTHPPGSKKLRSCIPWALKTHGNPWSFWPPKNQVINHQKKPKKNMRVLGAHGLHTYIYIYIYPGSHCHLRNADSKSGWW